MQEQELRAFLVDVFKEDRSESQIMKRLERLDAIAPDDPGGDLAEALVDYIEKHASTPEQIAEFVRGVCAQALRVMSGVHARVVPFALKPARTKS